MTDTMVARNRFTMLPAQYAWLGMLDPLPLMIVHALRLFDTIEMPGHGDNPAIIQWAEELGGEVARAYRHDAIAWCGLFLGVVANRAGKPLPGNPLWALNWARFGVAAEAPALGDVLVFKRAGGGHVGLYVGEDPEAYHLLGGNQADRVCFTRIARGRLFATRRPAYRNPPPTVRRYQLSANGVLSANEA